MRAWVDTGFTRFFLLRKRNERRAERQGKRGAREGWREGGEREREKRDQEGAAQAKKIFFRIVIVFLYCRTMLQNNTPGPFQLSLCAAALLSPSISVPR